MSIFRPVRLGGYRVPRYPEVQPLTDGKNVNRGEYMLRLKFLASDGQRLHATIALCLP